MRAIIVTLIVVLAAGAAFALGEGGIAYLFGTADDHAQALVVMRADDVHEAGLGVAADTCTEACEAVGLTCATGIGFDPGQAANELSTNSCATDWFNGALVVCGCT